ncbi:glucose PTS transporter subunit IIA [Alkalibacter saccharofermentans]|uniref:PTS system, glucose-specific IIC component n=1 Tax=Alkalibacter saccharofermentans DSM 14828 TaxID=1120975 RepID=A0A1M4T3B3_9FIRM|nr:glucose PTS transporter subunit IIA [Alkalibacter saccharofermentans]SHE38973.1 PTS system, glucose-specific IIC component [Alkalibacter saccharofermentans DSM 14828]
MSEIKKGNFVLLQKIGKSFMLPASVLPAAGLMVALSGIIQMLSGEQVLQNNPLLNGLVQILNGGGLAIFENMPLIFAVGVAIGFTAGESVAGLASLIGYIVLDKVLDVMGAIQHLESPIFMGVIGGIMIGLMSALIYKRFNQTKLHPMLGFFEGKRLVPILMVVISLVLGVVFGLIWPVIQNGVNYMGEYAINLKIGNFRLGGAIYALGNRALIPTGLHHIFKTPFTMIFGQYSITETGEVFTGEIARFFAGDPTAGSITAAEYPFKLFGLPAAALAMYMAAFKKNKKAIGRIMFAASLATIVSGITEPIEFAFMFVAPALFITHILLASFGGFLINLADVRLTETFTSSLIDYLVSISTGNAGNPFMLIPIGLVIGALYFGAFYFLILKLDLKTPGRNDDEKGSEDHDISQKAYEVLKALGGGENIVHIDACITRLRLEVKDTALVDKDRLKELGSPGVRDIGGGGVQVVFGTQAESLKDDIIGIMSNPNVVNRTEPEEYRELEVKDSKESEATEQTILKSPAKGKIIALKDVPDALFANKMIGDGFAVYPESKEICSPVDGEIVHIFDTNHAVGLRTDDGLEILVHIGIDTVKLKGEGFKRIAAIGQKVKAGDVLIECDLEFLKENAKSMITPVVVTNMDKVQKIEHMEIEYLEIGSDVMMVN